MNDPLNRSDTENNRGGEGMQGGYRSLAGRLLVICGGAAMLAAVMVELVAVIGRMTGLPLQGSIELVQVLVTIAGTTGLIMATLHGMHARVKLVSDRLSGAPATSLKKLNALLSALFFLCLCAGSVWLIVDLWHGFEETEIWRVSYRPLRIFVAAGTLVVAVLFLRQTMQGSE